MQAQYRILLVDDELEFLTVLNQMLTRRNMLVQCASSAEEAWDFLQNNTYDLIISDLAMPGISGIEFLKKVRLSGSQIPIIIMTGVGTIESAVEAVRLGAFNYITKPFKIQKLEELIEQAISYNTLQSQLVPESEQNSAHNAQLPMVIGNSAALQNILSIIETISTATVPVLIYGETGTGKSLLAKHIHNSGERSKKPFVVIDCAALPENLLESELFGHVKGAFTGAVQDKKGLLEEAQGGTIFLDEIGEVPLTMQVKLMRAIQEKEIRPVGGNKTINIDVQFITATNKNLAEEVEKGNFRKDLYYRLSVISLTLPPLRERIKDIPVFVGYFVQKFNKAYGKNIENVDPAALQLLMEQEWSGNIRELENTIERAVLLTQGTCITLSSLSLKNMKNISSSSALSPISLQQAVNEAEQKAIMQALSVTKGNRTRAAEILGIGRRTLYSKLEEYQITLKEIPE